MPLKTNPSSSSSSINPSSNPPRTRGKWKQHNVSNLTTPPADKIPPNKNLQIVLTIIVIVAAAIFKLLIILMLDDTPKQKHYYNPSPEEQFRPRAPSRENYDWNNPKTNSTNRHPPGPRTTNTPKPESTTPQRNPETSTNEILFAKQSNRLKEMDTLENKYKLANELVYQNTENNLFDVAEKIIRSEYFDPKQRDLAIEDLESIKNKREAPRQGSTESQSKIKYSQVELYQSLEFFGDKVNDRAIFNKFCKTQSLLLHPDKNKAADAEEKFKKLQHAMQIVRDYKNW